MIDTNSNPNPWVVQQGGGQPPLPRGSYMAEFVNAEMVKVPELKGSSTMVERIRWTWKVLKGEHANKLATPITDPDIKTTNKAEKFVSGLAGGRDVIPGENVLDIINNAKGKTYLISVGPGPQGGKDSVQSVSLPPEM